MTQFIVITCVNSYAIYRLLVLIRMIQYHRNNKELVDHLINTIKVDYEYLFVTYVDYGLLNWWLGLIIAIQVFYHVGSYMVDGDWFAAMIYAIAMPNFATSLAVHSKHLNYSCNKMRQLLAKVASII